MQVVSSSYSALPGAGHPTEDACLLDSAKPDDFDKLVGHTATSPLVCEAPSTVAMPHVFRKSQAKEGRILNDRPHKDVRVPPIALLYAPFGRFLDHIRDRPEEQPGVDLREFQLAVDEFASMMCEHFPDEDERRDEILPLLNAIFEIYHPFELPTLVPAITTGKRTSDGHAVGPAQLMETIVEIKNEFGSDHTDPEIQLTSYCLQMFNRRMISGRNKKSFEKYLCPTLVISIIGIKMWLSSSQLFSHTFFQVRTLDSVPLSFSTTQDLWHSPHFSRPVHLLAMTSTDLHCSKRSEQHVFCAITSTKTRNAS